MLKAYFFHITAYWNVSTFFSYKKMNKYISLVHKQSVSLLFQSMHIMQGPITPLNNVYTSLTPTECGFRIQGH